MTVSVSDVTSPGIAVTVEDVMSVETGATADRSPLTLRAGPVEIRPDS